MKKLLFYCVALLSHENFLLSASVGTTQKESKFAKLFQRAIEGDGNALYEIRLEAKKALGLSSEEKRKILSDLEKALDAAVEKKFQKLKNDLDAIQERKKELEQEDEKLEQEGKKGTFSRIFSGSMSTKEIAQKREAIAQEIEELNKMTTEVSNEVMKDISDISIPSRQIVDELAPMLDTSSQHIVASYDRTPYHDRVSLIDIHDFNVDGMPTDQTIDTYVRSQVSLLAKEGKVSIPKHSLSKEPFFGKVVNKVIDLHSVGKKIDDLPVEVQRHIDLYTSDLARKAFEASNSKNNTEMTKAYQDIQGVANQDIRAMTHEKILKLHDAQEAQQRQMVERQQAQERESAQRRFRDEDVVVNRAF